jgi:hypothetical protein
MKQRAGDGDNVVQIQGKGKVRNLKQKVDRRKTVVVTQPASPSEPPAKYEVNEIWRTPLTRWRIRIVSTVAFLGSMASLLGLALWPNVIRPIFVERKGPLSIQSLNLAWFWVGIGLLFVWLIFMTLGRITKHRMRSLSRHSWLPGLMEIDGRLAIVRFAGRCPGRDGYPCNAKLSFKAIPTSRRFVQTDKGGNWIPSNFRPAAVCPRDPDYHQWFIVTTQTVMDDLPNPGTA